MATDTCTHEELLRHYQWLRQYGINDSHSGNMSYRSGNEYHITPTGACADHLQANELVTCKTGQKPEQGASLDAPLHAAVYNNCPDSNVIIHSHGPYTLAMTFDGTDFEPADFEGQLYFPRVPVLTIAYGDYIDESPARVANILKQYPIMVVRGHGVYAHAENINLAYKWTCSLEQSAKTAWLTQTLNK